MSSVKEKIIGAVSVMSDKDAEKVWNLIIGTFSLADVKEIEPEQDEVDALKAYHDGHPDYEPVCSQEELMKELGL